MSTDDHIDLIRRIKLRLVTPLLALLFLSTVDRVNVSFAALQMNAELGLTPEAYGFGISIFFVGYILVQLPSLWLLQRSGMRRWLVTITLLWGLAATGMAFVHSKEAFYTLRVVLGIAEGGYAPGLMYYLASWIPKRYRAGALSNVMLAVPISVIVGGPLSGWLMSIDNPIGWTGWRWMLLIEGAPTIALGLASLWIFADRPRDARWLTPQQQRWVENEIAREQAPDAAQISGWSLLGSRTFWLATFGWFSLMTGAQGLINWLPQIIRHFSAESSDLAVGVLSAAPWLAVGVGMLVNAWHSDRAQERLLHVALPSLFSGITLTIAVISGGDVQALTLLVLTGLFMGAAQGTYWTIPPLLLSPAALAAGFGVINMCGNIAGVIVPYGVGFIRARTGSFDAPVFAMSAIMVLGAVALLFLRSSVAKDPEVAGTGMPADSSARASQ